MTPLAHASLAIDFYQITMCHSYIRRGMLAPAVFELFVRKLPPERQYVVACGIDDALDYLENLRFQPDDIDFLMKQGSFEPEFRDWLGRFKFSGDVYSLAEGTPVFAQEPILQVIAPLPEAQMVETALLNFVSFQSLIATKAARVIEAAKDRPVFDFGMRRTHTLESALQGARASYIAGISATSNAMAAKVYGIPLVGTMAHS